MQFWFEIWCYLKLFMCWLTWEQKLENTLVIEICLVWNRQERSYRQRNMQCSPAMHVLQNTNTWYPRAHCWGSQVGYMFSSDVLIFFQPSLLYHLQYDEIVHLYMMTIHAGVWNQAICNYGIGLVCWIIPSEQGVVFKCLFESISIQPLSQHNIWPELTTESPCLTCTVWYFVWTLLTHKQLQIHWCILSTVTTDALVLKHQAIRIHSAD